MSALNLNEVLLCGRLTADIELKQTESGRSVCGFNIAINRPKAKDSTEQAADFPSCVAWDKTAEFIAKYFKKGDSLYIRGKLRTRTYKDKATGRTVYVTEIVADEARFVDNKGSEPPKYAEPAQFEEIKDDGDLPF